MNLIKKEKLKLKAKRVFLKKGTCSRAYFYILNRQFGHPDEDEELAIDPLAGGIAQQGYQCGMIWGASMAVGTESFRRNKNIDQAIVTTILATQHIMESFVKRAKSIECEEITNCNFSSKVSMAKYFFSGKFVNCYILAGKWAPEALNAAKEGLSLKNKGVVQKPICCTSELAKKMGATDSEMVMLSGFAGGLGLSGSGCGALAAAIWIKIRTKIKTEKWKYSMSDPVTEAIINKFYEATDYEIECKKICGKTFKTIDKHTEFIKNGGCDKLIDILAQV